MRYLIESIEQEGIVGIQLQKWVDEKKISVLTKGDPIEQIKADLIKISDALNVLKKSGINKDIMIAYFRSKGLSVKVIEDILYHQNEFFRKLGLLK